MQSGIQSRRASTGWARPIMFTVNCWDTSFSDFDAHDWCGGRAGLAELSVISMTRGLRRQDWDICVQILIILSTRKLPYGIHTLASFKRLMNNLSRQTWNPSIREILNEKSIPNRNLYIPPFTFFSPNKSSPFGNVWSHREKIVHVQQCLSTG